MLTRDSLVDELDTVLVEASGSGPAHALLTPLGLTHTLKQDLRVIDI